MVSFQRVALLPAYHLPGMIEYELEIASHHTSIHADASPDITCLPRTSKAVRTPNARKTKRKCLHPCSHADGQAAPFRHRQGAEHPHSHFRTPQNQPCRRMRRLPRKPRRLCERQGVLQNGVAGSCASVLFRIAGIDFGAWAIQTRRMFQLHSKRAR
jgi:hypothetical protein